ncbi:MAG TPA: YdeI/OmpD-associated family protein [Planctomycetota bacterium]|nr:YdeI/OmpD-associated family protein [Planctomycetota bacterium]
MKQFVAKRSEDWRRWLEENHASEREVWLVFHKKHTGVPSPTYDESVEEALCFGWIDGIIKRLDDRCYARKFTPRARRSPWSELNKRRAERLIKAGRMAEAGLARVAEAKASGEWDADRTISTDELPQELLDALAGHPQARSHFDALPPSHRKRYVLWVASAKLVETRQKRSNQAVVMLERGDTLGLK